MDKAHALHLFWSSFGIPAIDEISAYDSAVMGQLNIDFPYITYEVASGNLSSPQQLTASIWYHSTSWAGVEGKAMQIANRLGWGGKVLAIDGGYLRIMLPEGITYRRMSSESDGIRRVVFNILVDFLTAT